MRRFERDPETGLLLPRREIERPRLRVCCGAIAQALLMGAGAPPPTDPNFSSVVLLLHGDGSNGSSTFTDSSSHGYTTFRSGTSTQIDTSQSKFGGASIHIVGGGVQSLGTSHRFDASAVDFTIECWIRPATFGSFQTVAINNTSTGTNAYGLGITAAGKVEFYGYNGSGTLIYNITGTTVLSANTWYHIAGTRNGNTFTLWVSGASEGTPASSASALRNVSDPLAIGTQGDGTSSPFDGWVDDFRLTVGVARYTAGFSVPTLPFPNS